MRTTNFHKHRCAVRRGMCFVLVFALAFGLSLAAEAQQSDRAKNLGKRMLCVCSCNQILTECNHVGCTYSHGMLKEIDERIGRGESDDLILQDFVQEYGASIMAQPGAKGFSLTAWLMPIFVPVAGLVLAGMVVLRWRKRAAASPVPRISPELLARAQKETARDED
jgi:cytochrome c-type biogenesis protein CcmH/NrfF